jgi:hypothetical protein
MSRFIEKGYEPTGSAYHRSITDAWVQDDYIDWRHWGLASLRSQALVLAQEFLEQLH